jgi:hypothetical protein
MAHDEVDAAGGRALLPAKPAAPRSGLLQVTALPSARAV